MGNDDIWKFGKESEIDPIGVVCKAVGEFVKAKYGPDENGVVRDWTGIGEFVIFYKDIKRTLDEQKIHLFSKEEIEEEWAECLLDDGELAIWWPEIQWASKIPLEVWQFMLLEGKRLGIQQIIEKLFHEWDLEDKKIFELIKNEVGSESNGTN